VFKPAVFARSCLPNDESTLGSQERQRRPLRVCYTHSVRRIPSQAWLLAIFSGVLQVLIFPSPSFAFLAWIALAPLLVAILRNGSVNAEVLDAAGESLSTITTAQAFWLGYVCGIVWYLGSCYWIYNTMHLYGELSPALSVGILILFALYLALYHGLFAALLARIAKPRGDLADPRTRQKAMRRALYSIPFLWVAVELARAHITGFPWDLLGTSQVGNIPLAFVSRWTGVYGVSFEIALVNTAFAAALLAHARRRNELLGIAVMAAVIFQAGVILHPRPSRWTHKAMLVQANIPVLNEGWTVEYFDKIIKDLQAASAFVATGPHPEPRLIVWPESPAPFYVPDPKFRQALAEVAETQKAFVLAGSLGVEHPEGRETASALLNSAILMKPDGSLGLRYDKIHLVPFGEYVPFKHLLSFAGKITKDVGDFTPGRERTIFELDGHKVGVFICYESVFPDEIRLFPKRGAEVLINISNDGWYGESGAPGQHLNMARMRAIENDRWVLRATNTGITAAIDPFGRLVDEAPRNVRRGMEARYDFISEPTFYSKHGDWFAYLCVAVTALALFVRWNLRGGVLRQ
jgi:apolipoprotein N-acyltransferase